FAAFLVPMALGVFGWRWLRSRAIESQWITIAGYTLLLISLPAMMSLLHFPDIRDAVPAGGLLGSVGSSGFLTSLKRGAYLVDFALLVVAIFMTTSFSFAGAHAWAAKGPLGVVERLGLMQRVASRWHAWRDAREDERMRRKLRETRTSGRKPVNQLTGKTVDIEEGTPPEPDRTIHLPDETDIFSTTRPAKKDSKDEDELPRERETHKAPIFVLDQKPERAPVIKKSG